MFSAKEARECTFTQIEELKKHYLEETFKMIEDCINRGELSLSLRKTDKSGIDDYIVKILIEQGFNVEIDDFDIDISW
jgi:hypothetical protein